MAIQHRAFSFPVLFAALTAPLYALDQLTKHAIIRNLAVEEGRAVIPGFFDVVHFRNTGAAFSMFSNANGFFIGLSSVAIVVLGVLAWRGAFCNRLSRLGWALLL